MKRSLAVLALLSVATVSRALAQGGPPMITDDPGTPGPNNWEINVGWTVQKFTGSTLYGVPLLDANYGVGDRIQINYQAPYGIITTRGVSTSGYGNSQLAVKWRYYDGGDSGWQASIYPRVIFLNPGSHDYQVGLADSETTVLLPAELVRNFGPVALDVDFGRLFCTDPSESGWTGGVALGHNVTKAWELDGEFHVNTSPGGLAKTEWILNAGTRIDLSDHFTLMGAIGADAQDNLLPKTSLLTFLGFQLRLGHGDDDAAAPDPH